MIHKIDCKNRQYYITYILQKLAIESELRSLICQKGCRLKKKRPGMKEFIY